MQKFYLVANPVSGYGKAKRDWQAIFALLQKHQIDHEVVFTEKPRHEQELVAAAIRQGYRNFISLGGDGTLNEMLNGIFSQAEISPAEITLGQIPVGTGNDWCRMFKIPGNYEKAIEIIKRGKIFLHDVGVAGFSKENKKHFFIIMAGLGYDGFVGTKMNETRKESRGGKLFYYFGILKYLFKYQPVEMIFKLDEKTISGKILTACVAITRFNGGGMMQAPFAVADDGLFDITIISNMSKVEMILNMPRLINGSFTKNKHVQTFKVKKVEVTAVTYSYIETDGETVGQTPVDFSILPRAINMIVA